MGGRYDAAAFLLGRMALRASEASSLEVGDHQQTVRGHRVFEFIGKAGLPAQMPPPVPVLRALDAAVGDRTDDSILLRIDGLPLGRSGLNTHRAHDRAGARHRVLVACERASQEDVRRLPRDPIPSRTGRSR